MEKRTLILTLRLGLSRPHFVWNGGRRQKGSWNACPLGNQGRGFVITMHFASAGGNHTVSDKVLQFENIYGQMKYIIKYNFLNNFKFGAFFKIFSKMLIASHVAIIFLRSPQLSPFWETSHPFDAIS